MDEGVKKKDTSGEKKEVSGILSTPFPIPNLLGRGERGGWLCRVRARV